MAPAVLDVLKAILLIKEKRMQYTSSGRACLLDVCFGGAAIGVTSVLWRRGMEEKLFDPLFDTTPVSACVALMAANGWVSLISPVWVYGLITQQVHEAHIRLVSLPGVL